MNALLPEEIKLLTEVGFLAGARGDLKSARKIFGALEMGRPHAPFPYVGLAMALLNRRQHDEAVLTLDRGLRLVDPAEASSLHAIRGLALQLAGRTAESERAYRAAGEHPMSGANAAGEPLAAPVR